MELLSLGIFILAFGICSLLTPLARRVARSRGWVDRPEGRKAHGKPTPLLGGAAIAAAYGAGCGAILLFSRAGLESRWPSLLTYGPPGRVYDPQILARLAWLAAGGVVIFLLGLADDRKPLAPAVKLAVQAAVALAVAYGGVRIDFYNPALSYAITVLWVVGITNAFNFLDNMDGLSAGVAMVAAAAFFVVTMQTEQYAVGMACAALAGAAAGFLLYNFHPASIFMGDAGSLFLGYTLASLTMITTFYSYGEGEHVLQLALPVLVMGLPLFDTATVLLIRWREKRTLFGGDRSHFSHRLVALGMSTREAVLINYLVAAVTGLGATLLYGTHTVGGLVILAQCLLVFAIVALLERTGRRKT